MDKEKELGEELEKQKEGGQSQGEIEADMGASKNALPLKNNARTHEELKC